MLQSDSKSIRQLLEDPDLTVEDLLDKEDVSSDIRNISLQFTNMLNYENMKLIIKWLIKEGEEGKRQSYKFPMVASEIVAMETPNMNQYLFKPAEEKQPLFEYLYSFTEEKDNYVLAGYFSKVIIAIIKRHSSSQFLQTLCQYFFEKGFLNKLINHLYSTSTIDLVMRIFTLRTKNNDYYQAKKYFVIQVLERMEKNQLSDEIVENIVFLVDTLLSYEPNTAPSNLSHTNLSKSPNHDIKEIAYEDIVILKIFQSLGETNRIRKSKAKIVNLYLVQFRTTDDYLLYRSFIDSYIDLTLAYLQTKSKQKSKITLEESFIMDNLFSILQFPIQVFTNKTINYLEGLFDLIIPNGWNNIFHQQLYKIVSLLLTTSSSQDLIKILINSLIKFGEISIKHYTGQFGYTEFIIKISILVLKASKKIKIQSNSQWDQFSENIQDIIDIQNDYSVGDYQFKPHTIAFVYSREIALQQYSQFLSTPTTIVYETKSELNKIESISNKPIVQQPEIQKLPKQQQANRQKLKQGAKKAQQLKQEHHLVFIHPQVKTNIETSINQSQTEDKQMLQYWRQRIHYSLDELINDI